MMRFGGRRRQVLPMAAEINLTNLIDVAFVLLIIFMITAPILQGGIEVQLPSAEARPLTSNDAVVVSIDQAGELYIERAKIGSLDEFATVMRTYIGGDGNRDVMLNVDRVVMWERVVEVMGELAKLDVNLGVSVLPRSRRNR
jgi:biopolymer transport protein ExbD